MLNHTFIIFKATVSKYIYPKRTYYKVYISSAGTELSPVDN
jgi:hypothetical protein